jgi:UDPglucose--hexose-1-phosphate uridylyltransferase
MPIELRQVEESLCFHSPLEGMALVRQQVLRRRDPLLGHWAAWASGLAGKGAFFFHPTDRELIERLAADTQPRCFFCPERVEQSTPRFPEHLVPGGALRRGECFLFPNLFPVAPVHAVVAMGHAHYRPLDDFPVALLADALGVAVELVRAYHRGDPAARWFTLNGNYLPPAGASLVHPHLQILGGQHPYTAVERLELACARWKAEHGQPFFDALLAHEECAGDRWIGRVGPACWLTAWAPQGANEVLAVLPGYAGLDSLDDPAIQGLATGLSRVLAGYNRLGFSTYNLSLQAGPCGDASPGFPPVLRIIVRQNMAENYRTDGYFLQRQLGEELMLMLPEELATELRSGW